MPTILTTGQITIVDNNDSKQITSALASDAITQLFTPEADPAFTPNWTGSGTGLVVSLYATMAGTPFPIDISTSLISYSWSFASAGGVVHSLTTSSTYNIPSGQNVFNDGGTITVGTNSITIHANIYNNGGSATYTAIPVTIYFTGTYRDSITGTISNVIGTQELTQVRQGTSATWIRINGATVLKPAASGETANKSIVMISADLLAGGVVVNSNITYQWDMEEPLSNTLTDTWIAANTGLYGFLDTKSVEFYSSVSDVKYIGYGGSEGTTRRTLNYGSIGKSYVTTVNGSNVITGIAANTILTGGTVSTAAKGILISQDAVTNLTIYTITITEGAPVSKSFTASFTIVDLTDPYSLELVSSAGLALKNGVGTTVITPYIKSGGIYVNNATGWSFLWQLNNKNGLRGGFVDSVATDMTNFPSGLSIVSHTTGATPAFTLSAIPTGTPWDTSPHLADRLIKCIMVDGITSMFFQVGSLDVSGKIVTVRSAATGTFDYNSGTVSWVTDHFPTSAVAVNAFVGGKLFVCNYYKLTDGCNFSAGGALQATPGGTNDTASLVYNSSLQHTAYLLTDAGLDIDVKGNFICSAIK